MKFLTILSLLMAFTFFQCSTKKDQKTNTSTPNTKTNMNEMLNYENVSDGIKYKFKAEMKKAGNYNGVEYPNDFVEIQYDLENTTEKDYIVYNRGHFGTNAEKVYVQPKADGTVEISQKAFEEPQDKNCPQRFVAVLPNASWLKAKQKVTEKIEVELPLQLKTPFDDCEPQDEMPKEIKQVKFCIGIAEADADAVKIEDNGRVLGLNAIKEQKLLCSDLVELK